MPIWDMLAERTRKTPDARAVVDGGLELSWAGFFERASRLGQGLRSLGIRPGDRVAVIGWNSHRFLEAYFATAGIGAILNPLNLRESSAALAAILGDSGSTLVLADAEFVPTILEARRLGAPVRTLVVGGGSASPAEDGVARVAWDALLAASPSTLDDPHPTGASTVAHLYFTSGTTGRAKGVMLTHGNVESHARAAVAELGLSSSDTWGHIAPLFHLADAWATFAMTIAGGTHGCVPRFDPVPVLDALSTNVTITNLVPVMLNALVKDPTIEGRRFPKLRRILSGGAPIAPTLVRRIMDVFGAEYVNTYGMTETSPYLTLSLPTPDVLRLSSDEQFVYRAMTGRPFLGVDLRVVRSDGTETARDGVEVGEIVVRGPTVTPGYWERPDLTEAAFVDGWLKTGDLAVRERRGWINIVDRAKDMIITGGEKVYSTEVEAAAWSHPAVLEAACFGRPSETWGEEVVLAVVPRPGCDLRVDDLLDHLRQRLSSWKVPKAVVPLDALPKTGSGKISKQRLRESWGKA